MDLMNALLIIHLDWLMSNGLKGKHDIELPEDIVKKTGKKYKEAYEKLTKRAWDTTLNSG